MANNKPKDELAEKLKALATPSSTPSSTSKFEVTDKLVEAPVLPTATKTTVVANEPLDNLIEMAKKSNAKLTESRMKDASDLGSSTVISDTAARLKVVSARVMQILKDNGMDSQQAERAHSQLMEL